LEACLDPGIFYLDLGRKEQKKEGKREGKKEKQTKLQTTLSVYILLRSPWNFYRLNFWNSEGLKNVHQ
jgi:hypothetical protein